MQFNPGGQPYSVLPDLSAEGYVASWLSRDRSHGIGYDNGPDNYTMDVINPLDVQWQSGGGACFGGTNGYLRSTVGAPFRASDSQGTITAWIKLDGLNGGQIVFSSSDEGSDTRALVCRYNNLHQLEIVIARGFGDNDEVSGTTIFVVGQWYHVVWQSTGTAFRLYVNGQAETLIVNLGGNTGDWLAEVPSRDNVTIGARFRSDGIKAPFEGEIRDVRYYSVPLE